MQNKVHIIGGGLAGCEAALQLADMGVGVTLFEAKPLKRSPAHRTDNLAEIVCSNSLKSTDIKTASGLLKAELDMMGCRLLPLARTAEVPAGNALAVDRDGFSALVSEQVERNPFIRIVSQVVEKIDDKICTVVATGPLTIGGLNDEIVRIFGKNLHFYDAAAPIVTRDSLNIAAAFTASRYGKGEDDYINCPMDKETYYAFVRELRCAERAEIKDFEKREIFEGCMPIEVMAARGEDTLRFGPLRPVGFIDPATGRRPFAVVQLRKENMAGDAYNLVGFQTNLKFTEQKRVFSMIPALNGADFVKYGVMHRNSYMDAPKALNYGFAAKACPGIFAAGQISGVEGYVESIMSGLIAAKNAARFLEGKEYIQLPRGTVTGELLEYLTAPSANFQPMNANFGLLPPLEETIRDKDKKKEALAARALEKMRKFLQR